MSMILDALRKMEQERKNGEKGGFDIPDVVCYTGRPAKKHGRRYWYAAGTLALLIPPIILLVYAKDRPSPVNSSAVNPPPAIELPAAPPQAVQSAQPAARKTPAGTMQAKAASHAAPQKPQRPNRQEATSAAAEAGNLVISGIAWQEERRLRRAVVNGELVSEGSEIAGSRVLEIRENRIRFTRNGHAFNVPYASAFTR